VAHENVHFPNCNDETRNLKLADENPKCSVAFERSYSCKQRQLNCCFLSLFYFLSIVSAFVTNIMSFIEALVRLRICLFRYVFCRRESSETCHFSTVFTLLLLTMVSVSHIYCRHRARFHCVSLNHNGCLNWVKLVKIPKQTFESQLTVINPCSVL